MHHREIVWLLRTHWRQAEAVGDGQLSVLETLCRSEISAEDPDLLDDLALAIGAIADLVEQGESLEGAVRRCRVAPQGDEVVTPGVHVLNAHRGKGLQFDWVVVPGLEEGFIPDFRSKSTQAEIDEELRVLHVMASRARKGLIFTVADKVRTNSGRLMRREPSRWLPVIEGALTES